MVVGVLRPDLVLLVDALLSGVPGSSSGRPLLLRLLGVLAGDDMTC